MIFGSGSTETAVSVLAIKKKQTINYGRKEELPRKEPWEEGKESIPSGGGKSADDKRRLCIHNRRGGGG